MRGEGQSIDDGRAFLFGYSRIDYGFIDPFSIKSDLGKKIPAWISSGDRRRGFEIYERLNFDFGAHKFGEFATDRSVAGPCRRSDQIAVNDSFTNINFFVNATCK